MDKTRKSSNEKPGERINQFIIECMFNKYFEEKEADTAVPHHELTLAKREKIAV